MGFAERIVSLGPAITEELYLLGVEDRLVGCTVYCCRPEGAGLKEKVGTVIDVDVEKIAALKPDLVLSTSLTDPRDIKKLKDLEIKVVCFPAAKNFSQICEYFLELGKIVGRSEQARILVEQAKARVKLIDKKIAGLPKPKVFIQTGAYPLYTPNKDSFVHDYILRAGGINIAADSVGRFGGGVYSRELVVKENPDVIIIVTMGIVGEGEKRAWQKFKTMQAVRNQRIYIVDSYRLCSPTPLSFAAGLEEIVDILHFRKGKQ